MIKKKKTIGLILLVVVLTMPEIYLHFSVWSTARSWASRKSNSFSRVLSKEEIAYSFAGKIGFKNIVEIRDTYKKNEYEYTALNESADLIKSGDFIRWLDKERANRDLNFISRIWMNYIYFRSR